MSVILVRVHTDKSVISEVSEFGTLSLIFSYIILFNVILSYGLETSFFRFYNTDKYGRFFGAEFIGNNEENNYPGIKFNFEDGIIWQEPGDNFIHHDIFRLPNGNYIGLGTSYGEGPIPEGPWTPLFQGLGFEADGETIEFDWMGDKIIE